MRAPKGPHGRAAVKAIGQTKTTGNFAKIAAYQNKLAKHEGKPAPYAGKKKK